MNGAAKDFKLPDKHQFAASSVLTRRRDMLRDLHLEDPVIFTRHHKPALDTSMPVCGGKEIGKRGGHIQRGPG